VERRGVAAQHPVGVPYNPTTLFATRIFNCLSSKPEFDSAFRLSIKKHPFGLKRCLVCGAKRAKFELPWKWCCLINWIC